MEYNRKISITSLALAFAFISCLVCIVYLYYIKSKIAPTKTIYEKQYVYVEVSQTTPETTQIDSPCSVWLVKEYFGQIGVFDDSGSLISVIEIYTKTLPETDRNLLREGISVNSREALESLIEDYCS